MKTPIKHFDILPNDLVRVRAGKNAGRVGIVVGSSYKKYKGVPADNECLTYTVRDPGSSDTISVVGNNLILITGQIEDPLVYKWNKIVKTIGE